MSTSSGVRPLESSSRTASKRNGKSSRLTTNPALSGTSTAVFPSARHQSRARSAAPSRNGSGKHSSTSSILCGGLKTWRPSRRSERSLAAAIAPMERDEVVVARSASGQAAPSSRSSSAFAPTSSTIASTTMSQSARSAVSVVTFTRPREPPSTFSARAWAVSSAFQADASLRARSFTSPSALAQATSPQAIVPLPATAGRVYPEEGLTRTAVVSAGSYRGRRPCESRLARCPPSSPRPFASVTGRSRLLPESISAWRRGSWSGFSARTAPGSPP